ncbi:TetR/AcrR family transcriptional regulator [Thauera sinica]|uniref:TetR/AcrR family transcriptional regulator n=1 Tax=Thauera sinica TaxID=2665146 RepID=A0ABW1APQ1_9RHOO|nr:TetR/AcrR family transcriptional regulator [Thauera sp. K11]ATE62210.1 TetR family transcriptional regulator [Thauera sp. K11]
MSAEHRNPSEQQRAEARREQILCAAATCFRDRGFHGASIAQISKAAGMSAGHIYHYFDNKESIIAAIVERDLEYLLTLGAELRAAEDTREALIEHVIEAVQKNLAPEEAGLKLEVMAEAARNPHVADIVRRADVVCRDSFAATLRGIRRANGLGDGGDAEIDSMIELIAAMFEGLMIRGIRNPGMDHAAVTRRFQAILRVVLSQPD